ncbi:tyrosine-type recombinase/integrase [Marihabitans asiaticum]|uniref:tyrosine-type recombinase/integrase n=1 Tax=Marihabitans asiaticum TaxID=415218 RepID=UPI0014787F0E
MNSAEPLPQQPAEQPVGRPAPQSPLDVGADLHSDPINVSRSRRTLHVCTGWGRRDLVFPSPEDTYMRSRNWRRRSGFDSARASLGLDEVTPHDLRRTFGSLARMAGADLRFIQKAMGHGSITTTARSELRAPL